MRAEILDVEERPMLLHTGLEEGTSTAIDNDQPLRQMAMYMHQHKVCRERAVSHTSCQFQTWDGELDVHLTGIHRAPTPRKMPSSRHFTEYSCIRYHWDLKRIAGFVIYLYGVVICEIVISIHNVYSLLADSAQNAMTTIMTIQRSPQETTELSSKWIQKIFDLQIILDLVSVSHLWTSPCFCLHFFSGVIFSWWWWRPLAAAEAR
jgi:hypothetical protein